MEEENKIKDNYDYENFLNDAIELYGLKKILDDIIELEESIEKIKLNAVQRRFFKMGALLMAQELTERDECDKISSKDMRFKMFYSDSKQVPKFDEKKVCCFTGNRPNKLPWGYDEESEQCKAVKVNIKETVAELAKQGYRLFVGGVAEGGDMFFAEAVLEVMDEYDIKLECAVPCPEQADRWSVESQERYNKIIKKSNYVTVISQQYNRYCFFMRNRYMVDKSSAVIALDYSGQGGSASTIQYAKSRGLKIFDVRA